MLSLVTIVAVYCVLSVPAALFGLPWTLIRGDIGWLYRWAMWILRTGLRLGRIRVEVSGREAVPAGVPCIFMSNHVSNLDPPILMPLLPFRTAFLLKRSLLRIPVLGLAMRLGDFVPVARDGRVESARESVQEARATLESGVSISTFPEGTRSPDGRLLPFKKGAFYLAIESRAPVVPISIWGSEALMPKSSLRIRPGTAHLVFHPPLLPERFDTREDLMAAVRASIASGLPEWMRNEPRPAASARA
jgi:1-acyl-sn-glycerol-3-phosphate acyltransferase